MSIDLPPECDWFFWRILSSQYVSIRMVDLPHLSYLDIQNTHAFLDAFEPAMAEARGAK